MDFECRGWPPQPQIFSSSSTKITKKFKISSFSFEMLEAVYVGYPLSSKSILKIVSQMARLCDYATVLFSYLHIGFLTFLVLLKNTFWDGTPCSFWEDDSTYVIWEASNEIHVPQIRSSMSTCFTFVFWSALVSCPDPEEELFFENSHARPNFRLGLFVGLVGLGGLDGLVDEVAFIAEEIIISPA